MQSAQMSVYMRMSKECTFEMIYRSLRPSWSFFIPDGLLSDLTDLFGCWSRSKCRPADPFHCRNGNPSRQGSSVVHRFCRCKLPMTDPRQANCHHTMTSLEIPKESTCMYSSGSED